MPLSLNEAVISAAGSNTETIPHVSPLEGHEGGFESASSGETVTTIHNILVTDIKAGYLKQQL